MKLKLGIDLDDTLNDLVYKILPEYNKKYKDNLDASQIHEYNIYPYLNPDCTNIFKEFASEDLFMSLEVKPDAIDVLNRLNEKHEIYFASSGHPKTARARDKWLSKKFKWYKTNQLIICQHKRLLGFDVLLDDCYNNLIGGSYKGIIFTQPWNQSFDNEQFGIARVNNFTEFEKIINELENV